MASVPIKASRSHSPLVRSTACTQLRVAPSQKMCLLSSGRSSVVSLISIPYWDLVWKSLAGKPFFDFRRTGSYLPELLLRPFMGSSSKDSAGSKASSVRSEIRAAATGRGFAVLDVAAATALMVLLAVDVVLPGGPTLFTKLGHDLFHEGATYPAGVR
jgi:hypothetical protein